MLARKCAKIFLTMAMSDNFQAEQVISSNPTIFRFNGGALLTSDELASTREWPADLSAATERVIQRDQRIYFRFRWSVSGLLVPLLSSQNVWHLEVFFEKMGGGEIHLGGFAQTSVNFVQTSGHVYDHTMIFPPNSIEDGVYDVVAVIRFRDSRNRPGPIAAFAELGKITVYED